MSFGTGHTHVKRHIKNKNYESRELVLQEDEKKEEYARIDSALGAGRFMATILKNNIKVNVGLPNRFKKGPKKQKVEVDSIVLLCRINESIQDIKYDIINIYTKQHVVELLKMKEIISINPENKKNNSNVIIQDEYNIVFEDNLIPELNESKEQVCEIDFDDI